MGVLDEPLGHPAQQQALLERPEGARTADQQVDGAVACLPDERGRVRRSIREPEKLSRRGASDGTARRMVTLRPSDMVWTWE